ncbi:MAG TPA: FAD-dependent oxidoreductase [Candidatus Limnocylindrales bacterium]|nr:FAD-dependent oxidoreductase [Candidatus Limnocylindrales bacterium]
MSRSSNGVRARTGETPDVVVVGAGVMGLWTAIHLLDAGLGVTVVDAFGPGDARQTSSDETRISRASHGGDALYARWSRAALRAWIELGDEAGTPTFVPCGVAWFAHRDHGFEAASEAALRTLAIPVERLTLTEAADRWPIISTGDLAFVIHEPEAGALRARVGIRAAADAVRRRGGEIRLDRARPGAEVGDRLTDVVTDRGERISAGSFVFAAGPWLPSLFPDLVGNLISVTKQDVVHFGPVPGDGRFEADRLPAWIDYDEAIYGIPGIDGHGPKVPPDAYGPPFDPDAGDRIVDPASVRFVRDYLARRLPDLAGRPVIESRVCQYESTPDTHFLIDRHPALVNAWLVGGGSGHAFKQGPEIGRYAAALVTGGVPSNAPDDERFSLARDRRAGAGVRAGSDSARPVPATR